MYTVHPIAHVHCSVTEMSQGSWAEVESEIRFQPEYVPGLQGLEGFSHVLVVFLLHQAQGFDLKKQLLRRPRGMENLDALGVFAQRTKYRPNPIATTAVRLLGIQNDVVRVQGLDALDGTPVLDLKPYMPPFDRMEDVTMPPWVQQFLEGYF